MAVSNLKNIVLYDNWPGYPNVTLQRPDDGWDGSVSCCQSAPLYPPGTKILYDADNTHTPGASIMAYMRYSEGSDFAAGAGDTGDVSDHTNICCHMEGTDALVLTAADATVRQWWNVTNDTTNSDATTAHSPGAVAVATRAMSTGEYGWFWVGGPCPYTDVTKFDNLTGGAGVDVLTVSVAAGVAIGTVDASNAVTFGVYDGSRPPCGYATNSEA